jgi:ATP-binding cassette subfamily B (MDR/TAP) protein 1
MTLLFGRLTQDFVAFGIIVTTAQSGDPVAQALLPEAAANFRSAAASNAAYLVCIGKIITTSKESI